MVFDIGKWPYSLELPLFITNIILKQPTDVSINHYHTGIIHNKKKKVLPNINSWAVTEYLRLFILISGMTIIHMIVYIGIQILKMKSIILLYRLLFVLNYDMLLLLFRTIINTIDAIELILFIYRMYLN